MIMRALIGILLLCGMLKFQSRALSLQFKVIAGVVGLFCFVGLIAWSYWSSKKRAADPTLMLNDTDADAD